MFYLGKEVVLIRDQGNGLHNAAATYTTAYSPTPLLPAIQRGGGGDGVEAAAPMRLKPLSAMTSRRKISVRELLKIPSISAMRSDVEGHEDMMETQHNNQMEEERREDKEQRGCHCCR